MKKHCGFESLYGHIHMMKKGTLVRLNSVPDGPFVFELKVGDIGETTDIVITLSKTYPLVWWPRIEQSLYIAVENLTKIPSAT